MAPGTESARDFSARIGPLQLGVVLVFVFLKSKPFFMQDKVYCTQCNGSLMWHINGNFLQALNIFDGVYDWDEEI